MSIQVKVDGIEIEVPNEPSADAIDRALAARDERIAQAEVTVQDAWAAANKVLDQVKAETDALVEAIRRDTDGLRARAAVAETKLADLQVRQKEADQVVRDLVRSRATLERTATDILAPGTKVDALSDRKLKELVVAKLLPDLDLDGASDSYVDAVYRGACAARPTTRAAPVSDR